MKLRLGLLFFMLCVQQIIAQNTINGTIKNNSGEVVSNASVTLENPGEDAIIAYAISNAKGEYTVKFNSSSNEVVLKVKAFNHETVSKTIKNTSQKLDFTLSTKATEIEEVRLKTRLITQKGDTIDYDLKSFAAKKDRTLADVLKNMPNVEVKKDGSILYKGEPLSKFYVNGKDLMEGGYGVITNSLPKDAVSKVQVLENHQPLKILQGKVPSDAAAINIKLKRKVTMTGRGEVGSGFADPWLWNVKLTPMFFGQKSQWVINYKTNNTGETVEREGMIFGMGNRWEGRRSNAFQDSWLSVDQASVPSVPEERYLFNNVHFLSANYLVNLDKKKEWELKANANYTNNVVDRESFTESIQLNPAQQITINEKNRFFTNKAKAELIFLKNAKEGFFKNVTTFNQFWNTDRANVDRRSLDKGLDFSAYQSVSSPTSSFQNSLSTIIPWKEKLVNVMSFISYQDDHQNLEIRPGSYLATYEPAINGISSYSLVDQDYSMKTFSTENSANVSFSHKLWTITPEIGFRYDNNHLFTSLYGDNQYLGDRFQNDLKYSTTTPYATVRLNYDSQALKLNFNLPANFNSIKAEDPNPFRNVSKSLDKFTFEPSFFGQYSFASFWKARLYGSINYNFGEINTAYAGGIFRSPSNLNSMDANNPIPVNLTKSIGSRIEYRNPLNNLFFNVGYNISDTKRNLLSNTTFLNGFININYFLQDNKSQSNSFSAELGKYFPSIKTNLSTSYRNTIGRSEFKQNADFVESKSTGQTIGFSMNNSMFSWMTLDYNFSLNYNKRDNDFVDLGTSTQIKSDGYSHNLGAYFYPKDDHTIGFFWDQLNTNSALKKYSNAFFDLSYQYTWDRKKVDFELKWMNIANTKVFEDFSINNNGSTYSRMPIRPRQLMLTVKFNFK